MYSDPYNRQAIPNLKIVSNAPPSYAAFRSFFVEPSLFGKTLQNRHKHFPHFPAQHHSIQGFAQQSKFWSKRQG